jgi:superfamily II RNA helicase
LSGAAVGAGSLAGSSRPAGLRRRFLADLAFTPDPFQLEAFDAIDAGHSVLVSAPTGSGKTLVAAYAIYANMAARAKSFYTTPLKALSNQKFNELTDSHGVGSVGLLTGDVAIGPRSPIVVMTTEVLRNMLLAGSELLEGLGTVVLDEVHYLQDPYRGGVWEEVLVLAPPEVSFVCLSATVANATELAEWLRSVRGPTEVIVERRRPSLLRHHFAVHRREDASTDLVPLIAHGRPGSEGLRVEQAVRRAGTTRMAAYAGHGRGPQLPVRAPRRVELIDLLDEEDLLPAIFFIFSRAACDDAVRQCLRDGLRLTSRTERATIRAIAEHHTEALSDDDLAVLAYPEWLEGLESGIAAHHAGLVPAFRETVEECFEEGVLKTVFATETLSLGINMPARTVVIERFTKFGGAGKAPLTSGEYAQLTGRAGRRGLDPEGHAVVCWSQETPFSEVARVALAAPPDLRSTFRPTYNLAVNLVRRFDRDRALEVLRRSFGQWQLSAAGRGNADLLVEHLERRLNVLSELGYVDGWRLTESGERLARIYHECDLVVAEALSGAILEDAEPAVVAGVLSGLVVERRRVRTDSGHRPRGARRFPAAPPPPRKGAGGDRLGEGRRRELAERGLALLQRAEGLRLIEERHEVPKAGEPELALATAIASWTRGATFGTALAVAEREAGEIAPGDFVRTVRRLVDLVGQVAIVAPDQGLRAAAEAAQSGLMRDVVAAGALPASAIAKAGPP